jgi:hypothetical protein
VGAIVGALVGAIVGVLVGAFVGFLVGTFVGCFVGTLVGCLVGALVGCCLVGALVGFLVGATVGFFVGARVGFLVGALVGDGQVYKLDHIGVALSGPLKEDADGHQLVGSCVARRRSRRLKDVKRGVCEKGKFRNGSLGSVFHSTRSSHTPACPS